MRKLKLLFAACALLASSAVSAQTDVTSTYLTNADFSEGTLASPAITTYDYDMEKHGTTFCNLVALDGWTAVDNGNGKAGGPVAIGSGVWVGGSDYKAPPTNSDGEVTGNVLGIVGCWSASAQYTQDLKVEMPAGTYTIVLGVYNSKGGTNAIDKNLIGFVETGGTEHLAETKQYPVNTWKYEFISFTLDVATSGYVSLGYKATNTGSGNMPHLFISGLEIYEGTVDAEAYEAAKTAIREAKEAKVLWDNAKADADKALADAAYVNVIGVEKANLEAEVAKAEPTTADDYKAATKALTDAITAFTAAKVSYEELIAEIAYAKTLGISTSAAEAAQNSEATAESVIAAAQELKLKEYTTINDTYKNDVTSLLGTWDKGTYGTTSGQGYISDETYFDKWNGSAVDLNSSAIVSLPAGKYVVKVAGRGHGSTTMNLSVKVGEEDAVSTPFLMHGDTGKGIDTSGATNFSDEGTYSNEGAGRGWQYRYITFTTDGTSDVTIAISGHLVGNSWQSFYAPVLLCDDATFAPIALDAAKADLQSKIDNAPAVPTTNIGTGVFQLPEAGVTAYSEALVSVQAAHDAADADEVSLGLAKATLEEAIKKFNELELNAPADGQLFNIVLTYESWTYDNKAMTFIANGRNDAGLYNIQYKEDANKNLAQAFTFTKVSGNNYKLSQIDADGAMRYICTGVVYGGNTAQIRTTTNAEEALEVTIIPTAAEGVYNLKNTEANNYIGSQDAGVFTVNSHIDFKLVETTKPSIDINTTAAGWGTVMLPFSGLELPVGVTAYTCAAVEGTTLTLAKVESGVLEANKPYIIEGAWKETVTNNAQGTALTYTEGLLTGVYADTDAPVSSYVLQNLDSKVGFYKVAEGKQPSVGANHAYLTVPASEVRAYFFGGEATGIETVKALMSGTAEIYSLGGARQNGLQKGVNIIKQNGKTMKVMVK